MLAAQVGYGRDWHFIKGKRWPGLPAAGQAAIIRSCYPHLFLIAAAI
jgi:hypothetical protein